MITIYLILNISLNALDWRLWFKQLFPMLLTDLLITPSQVKKKSSKSSPIFLRGRHFIITIFFSFQHYHILIIHQGMEKEIEANKNFKVVQKQNCLDGSNQESVLSRNLFWEAISRYFWSWYHQKYQLTFLTIKMNLNILNQHVSEY